MTLDELIAALQNIRATDAAYGSDEVRLALPVQQQTFDAEGDAAGFELGWIFPKVEEAWRPRTAGEITSVQLYVEDPLDLYLEEPLL